MQNNGAGYRLRRHFSDPQVFNLLVVLIAGVLIFSFLGQILAPVFASLVISYLLSGLISFLESLRVRRWIAVTIVFIGFLALFSLLLLGLFPLVWVQVAQFLQRLPDIIVWSQNALMKLPQHFPELISEKQLAELMGGLGYEITSIGQRILSYSVASVRSTLWFFAYVFLIPIMVYSFLIDEQEIMTWVSGFLPKERTILNEVWRELDQQMGRFIRGKFLEIVILWAVTYAILAVLGLEFLMLTAFLTGLSVLVPYVGATVMTLLVASIAYFQWGWGTNFVVTLTTYVIIHLLHGYVLVPLMFSEVVNLHPVAIIVSMLIAGDLWGFWGLFFSIPLTTLANAIVKSWSRYYRQQC
ncbi:MAG: AI-2E family transporter [Desulfobacteraceae bacterium]|nr:MAG: AI-2E family transporter [Desulfobacteraceae bacterium]